MVVGLVLAAAVIGTGGYFIANGVFSGKPSPAATPTCDVIGVNGCTTKGANGGGPAIAPTTPAVLVKTAPDPKGFTIGVTILRKACFGSAGCNVTFRIDPSYNGADYTHTTTWRIVYQVKGTSDAYTNSFTLTGSEASMQSEEMVETPSSSATLTATAVSVVEA
jgi:hypothetical protein